MMRLCFKIWCVWQLSSVGSPLATWQRRLQQSGEGDSVCVITARRGRQKFHSSLCQLQVLCVELALAGLRDSVISFKWSTYKIWVSVSSESAAQNSHVHHVSVKTGTLLDVFRIKITLKLDTQNKSNVAFPKVVSRVSNLILTKNWLLILI